MATANNPIVRVATLRDLKALTALENKAFKTDRFSDDQIEYLIARAHSTVLIMELDGLVAGSAYLLWRKKLTLGRLYNIAINPKFQGQGLGAVLLEECEIEAARRQCNVLSLEVRLDNRQGIAFYEKHGFRIVETMADYYEDGSPGLKMVKDLDKVVPKRIRLKVPYYGQTMNFTCGPASLMMAFKYFLPELKFSRALELTLWKEATLVFMTSGMGGCDPFGLALSSRRRGFLTRVILSKEQSPFFSSVRDPEKRKVIRVVHEDLKEKVQDLSVPVSYFDFPFEEIAAAMYRGRIPIVLISTYRLTGERAPHWVVITGFDGKNVYFNDPDLESYDGNPSYAKNVKIPIDEFSRMRRYGRDLYKSVIFVGPRQQRPLIAIDGSDV